MNSSKHCIKEWLKNFIHLGKAWYCDQTHYINLVQSSKKVKINEVMTNQKGSLKFRLEIEEFQNNILVTQEGRTICYINLIR
ncbi:unnamed protein product [Paramecium pentaurelia]|uniref:Uncharacterized protein n=1 Tax=Paramecium pentaurelia TaxID=43138 RepID=A0A8S1XL70_9CILI|nr:unnamed protein product [Paramecium pentaurelia]